jgi:hypothetical protein
MLHNLRQCCGWGMFIPGSGSEIFHPGSRISDPTSYVNTLFSRCLPVRFQEEVLGEGQFHKDNIKEFWRKFHQKSGPDPGSEIRKKFIPDPGGKKAPDSGSGSAKLTEVSHWLPTVVLSHKTTVSRLCQDCWRETSLLEKDSPCFSVYTYSNLHLFYAYGNHSFVLLKLAASCMALTSHEPPNLGPSLPEMTSPYFKFNKHRKLNLVAA